MKISITSFGGNADNYYNFKQNYLVANGKLCLSHVYVNPNSKKTDLEDLDRHLFELKKMFVVEFED